MAALFHVCRPRPVNPSVKNVKRARVLAFRMLLFLFGKIPHSIRRVPKDGIRGMPNDYPQSDESEHLGVTKTHP